MDSYQPTLFDPPEPVPFVRRSKTSIRAARRQTGRVSGDRLKVLTVMRAHPHGLTDWQGWPLTDIKQESTYRARRIGLVELGLVVDSGRTDESEQHLKSTVWVTLENGLGAGKTTAQVASMTSKTNGEAWGILVALESEGLIRQEDVRWVKR